MRCHIPNLQTNRTRPTYKAAILWIAGNDENGGTDSLNASCVQYLTSVALIADLFGKTTADVAADVVRARLKARE